MTAPTDPTLARPAPYRPSAPASGGVAARQPETLPVTGFAIVLGSAALFGMLGPLARFAYEAGMTPAGFVAWRAIFGLSVIALVVTWRVRTGRMRLARWSALPGRVRAALFASMVTGFTLNLGMFVSFDRITIALALLGFYTYPAMVAVVDVARGRELLDAPRVVALALALAGMVAVVAAQLDPAAGIRLDGIGVAFALGAAVSQTIYVVVSRDGYRDVPTEQAIGSVLAFTIVGAIVLGLLTGGPGTLTHPLEHPDVLPLLLFTGAFAAAIPSLGFLFGIRAIGGLRAGILMLFEPVVGVALAAWLLGEALVPIQLVGAAAILGAALILQRATRPSPTGEEPAVIPTGP